MLHVAEKPKVCSRQAQVDPGPRPPGPWSPTASHNSQLGFLLSGKPGSFSALGETPGLHHSLSAAYTESQN